MKTPIRKTIQLAAACAIGILASCGGDPKEPKAKGGEGGGGLPKTLLADTAPEGAVSVVDARKQGKPGEAIVLRGKVGGKMSPLSKAAAVFVLADEKAITSCDDIPGDECETPWDYCCADPDDIKASIITIQVRGEDGKVVRSSARGLGGMKELSRLVISGTIDETSTDEFMVVNATKIHVEKP